MRHKLLYLLALALTATSSGWGQEDSGGVPSPFSTQQIDKTDLKNTTGLFANGHAITIETGSSEGKSKFPRLIWKRISHTRPTVPVRSCSVENTMNLVRVPASP